MAAVLDGVPGNPNNGHGTHIKLGHKDGVLIAAEGGYGDLESGRVGVGGWWYSAKADHLSDTDVLGNPIRERSNGEYILTEITLFNVNGDAARHVGGFVRFAKANDAVSQFDFSGSTGLTYTGPFESRKDDVAGITFHGAHNGSPYRTAAIAAGSPVKTREWGAEATYSAQITPWLKVQPDIQYLRNPGTAAGVDHALILGTRLKVNL